MVIRFLCPNGHKIHCPDDRAGKAAKCPKCGVKFQIPELSELQASDSEGSEAGGIGSAAAGTAEVPGEEMIEFLCPNGHRLHGPASLQGRPGQCPQCESRFRVPSYDEVPDEEEEEPEQQITFKISDSSEDAVVTLEEVEEIEGPEAGYGPGDEEMPTAARVEESGLSSRAAAAHAMVELVSKLWAEKAHGAVIELHLSDGEKLIPDRFAERLSRGRCGVFTVKNPDGTHTLTAVAWDSVSRVVVQGLKRLPDKLLD